MRHYEFIALALAAFASGSGCALEAGWPWGVVAPSLTVRFDVGGGRIDDVGRVRTSDDYRVAVARIEVDVASLSFVAGESAALNFDPANPPPGYTLCHNGHCHATDGRLVDYADIAAELASGGAAGGPLFVIPGGAAEVSAKSTVAPVALGVCADGCGVYEPVELAVARVEVAAVSLSGRVFDARSGDARRLAEEGVPFDVVWEPAVDEAIFAATLGARFGPGKDAGYAIDLALVIGADAFDGVPWADGETLASAISQSVSDALMLVVDGTSRFSP